MPTSLKSYLFDDDFDRLDEGDDFFNGVAWDLPGRRKGRKNRRYERKVAEDYRTHRENGEW